MHRSSSIVRRIALTVAAALLLLVGSAGPAQAADPTPEQKKQAARTAGEALCADSVLKPLMGVNEIKEKCVQIVASALVDKGTALTTPVLCGALSVPAGPLAPVMFGTCTKFGGPLIEKAVQLFKDGLKAAGAVVDVVKFVADPTSALDGFANTLKDNSVSLVERVLRQISSATAFDADADWWLKHYAASAGIGVLVMVVMMLITSVQAARNQLSGDEMHDAVFKHLPTGLLLMVFGPALGKELSDFSNALTNGIITFIRPDMDAFLGDLAIFSSITAAVPGGVIIGIIIFLMVFLGALALLVGLLLQTLTLYFTGLACAIAFGMWVNPKWRKKAAKIPFTWLGILLAKPLLFLLLGAAFGLANFATSATSMSDPGIKTITTALLAALALLVAGLAPFSLLKYAPLLPDGSDSVGGTGGGMVSSAATGTASQVASQIAMRRAYGNSDAAGRQEAAVNSSSGGDDGASPGRTDPEPSATPAPGRRSGADPAKSGGTDAAKTGGTEAAPSGGANGATTTGAGKGAATTGTGQGAATTGATTGTAGAGAGTGAGAGAGAGTAAAAGAGAATGGIALGVIAAAEVGRAAVEKAKSIAENAPPDIPAKDGD